jgi:N-acetylglucosaminyldiphosphoundecaprenol N-acetyl-beta-D-mannosaminyltransferase
MGVVLLARVLKLPITRDHRVTYVDWVPHLIRDASRFGWRVFYLGSKPGVAEKAARQFRSDYPQLEIATRDGYFDMECDSSTVIDQIRSFRTNLLMVGMGMPRQELWDSSFPEGTQRDGHSAKWCSL